MMNDEKILRAAIYTRVSTEDQAKSGFSLESQLGRLRDYCSSRDWPVAGTYVEDGESGRTTKRPAYQQMMDDIEKWDVIVVIKMDRIHRSSRNFAQMIDDLHKINKEFVSTTESLDTSNAMGRFVADIIARIAQLESEQTGERTSLGMRQMATDLRIHNGGRPPYGYRLKERQLIPVKSELALVKRCFELYDNGAGMHEVARILSWHYSKVQYVLKDAIYAGFLQWCHVFKRMPIQPVVSIELWNRVQQHKAAVADRCKTYQAVQLQDRDQFELSPEERMNVPNLTRPKHKLT